MKSVTAIAAIVSLITHGAVMGALRIWSAEDSESAVRIINLEITAPASISAPDNIVRSEAISTTPARARPAVSPPPRPQPKSLVSSVIAQPVQLPTATTIEIVRLPISAPKPNHEATDAAPLAHPDNMPSLQIPVIAVRPEKPTAQNPRPKIRSAGPSQASLGVVIDIPTTAVPGNPHPRYPSAARKRGYEGQTIIRAQIGLRGNVLGTKIVRSSGHTILDTAASKAVTGWEFRPARRDGRPVTGEIDIPIEFRLQ